MEFDNGESSGIEKINDNKEESRGGKNGAN